MKTKYETTEIEIIEFETEDVITTSDQTSKVDETSMLNPFGP